METILKNENVVDFIKENKKVLREVFHSLVDAYKSLFPDGPLRLKILGPLLWNVVKWKPEIRNVFILHDKLDMKELQSYGGPVSEKICEEILKVLEVDLEDIKLKNL